jgi:ubiquinone/menaquinone biosynthesis C-methylase UbiE
MVGMIEKLPYEDEFFDFVMAKHVLEHSSDLNGTMQEIARVLKPQGYLLFAVPQGWHDEPAHITQTDSYGWRKLLSSRFKIRFEGWHDFKLREYYGIAQVVHQVNRVS